MPLHYGGRINKKGNLASTPYQGIQFKTMARIEKLVRLDQATTTGVPITDAEIGRILKCSKFLVRLLRRKPEYLQLRMEVLTGISTSAENAVEAIVAARKQALRDMLPMALRVVADTLTNPLTNSALKAKIALEVLDREGTYPKISRSDVHHKVEHDYGDQDQVSKELLGYMDKAQDETNPSILKAIDANKKFSNSETLSPQQQEAAMAALEALSPTTERIQ